jgi:GT2 family glycosyltransferase
VNWNGGEVFKKSLLSIQQIHKKLAQDYEIIVVDNASTDLDEEWISQNIRNISVHKNSSNTMFAKGTNLSVALSSGDLLCIINNDIIFHSDCINTLIEALEKYDCQLVVPKMLNANGTVQKSISGFPSLKGILGAAIGLNRISSKADTWLLHHFDYNTPSPVKQPMFAAMLMPRDTWLRVGIMDESFPLLFNDVDWFKRFADLGFKAYYVPDAVVTHVHGMSVNKKKLKKIYMSTVGMHRYFKKHGRKNWMYRAAVVLVAVFTFMGRLASEFIIKPVR